jgi:hypothetical protein|tara:strand:+ start:169 stop:480 length:312 start_codon:yes stop_codon:yes gene_type:complete
MAAFVLLGLAVDEGMIIDADYYPASGRSNSTAKSKAPPIALAGSVAGPDIDLGILDIDLANSLAGVPPCKHLDTKIAASAKVEFICEPTLPLDRKISPTRPSG